jgi:lipopolysaccharide export system protein LptC
MPIELDLPDLPPLTLGADPPSVHRRRQPWPARVLEAVMSYLPVLLMALLAASTWWLVQNTPVPEPERAAAPPRQEPDYTMERFTLQRFGPDGRLRVQIDGEQLRHYPDTDRLEIDIVRIRAVAADGALTLATARRAIANADASEVQLLGGAQVTSDAGGQRIEFRGEFLHAYLLTERLRSHLPVQIRRGASELRAGGMEYDHLTRTVQLKGPVRAVFVPPGKGGQGQG